MSHHIQKLIQNIDLKVRNKRIKLLKQSIGSNLHLPGLENGFLDKTTKVQVTIAKKIGKLDTIKIKTLCAQEDNVKKEKRQVTEW